VDARAQKAAWLCLGPPLDALPPMVVYLCFALNVGEDCPLQAVAQETHSVKMLALMMDPQVAQAMDSMVVQPVLKAELASEQAHSPEAQPVQASPR
jgi:hypothetical protein